MIVDRALIALISFADQRTLEEICTGFPSSAVGVSRTQAIDPRRIRASLACLVEAGVLQRSQPTPSPAPSLRSTKDLVSVVIVSFNSQPWLDTCLPSLRDQSHEALEIIVVDNASSDDTVDFLRDKYPDIRLIRLQTQCSFAYALNKGVNAGAGSYYLLLNPDTVLAPDAIAQLVNKAKQHPDCAAVAPKLRLSWAPHFLNGLGNSFGAFLWGTDNAIGHLDLGQFDDWDAVPSACFAAALIPAKSWRQIGPLDESLPLYYEDSEWCYRARLFGYAVIAAPQALIYHAFGSRTPAIEPHAISCEKLRYVTISRLRVVARLLTASTRFRFMLSYLLDDCARFLGFLFSRRWSFLRAILHAWVEFIFSRPNLNSDRQAIQRRRQITDSALFAVQANLPAPLIRAGLPRLTWDIIQERYLPLFLAHKTRAFPEFEGEVSAPQDHNSTRRVWQRARQMWYNEGLSGLLYHLAKAIQWRLATSWLPGGPKE